jgi:hypothetical protein
MDLVRRNCMETVGHWNVPILSRYVLSSQAYLTTSHQPATLLIVALAESRVHTASCSATKVTYVPSTLVNLSLFWEW